MVFVVTSMEKIATSKEARKKKQLGDSAQKALSAIRQETNNLPTPNLSSTLCNWPLKRPVSTWLKLL
jgi:brefeldin A-inhibited guanine nucleotide-exchange protein